MAEPEQVIVVEDDAELRELLDEVLSRAGYGVASFEMAEAASAALRRGQAADLVITDRVLPGMSGDKLLVELRTERPELNVIVITAFASVESAITLVRAGAFDYLVKPFSNAQLLEVVARALGESEHRRVLASLARSELQQVVPGFIGQAPVLTNLTQVVVRAARSRHPVMIVGETGTGKELIARGIHAMSGRSPFVAVNCGALPENLLESELFGHERGAFTGAMESRSGLLAGAHGGTVFLDEIGELPLALQPKLLRALEGGEVRAVGASKSRILDFRLISATNRDLEEDVRGVRFRDDLYWRINVLQIVVPSLRARSEDIPLLAEHFLQEAASEQSDHPRRFTADALAALSEYPWPGNVRELRNAVHQASVLATGRELGFDDLPARIRDVGRPAAIASQASLGRVPLRELERRYILEVLKEVDGNKSQAAELLGISRRTIHRKLEEYASDDENDGQLL